MKKMDALLIIKQELYKDTIPSVEVLNALDCLEEYITNSRAKLTREALANIRKNTLKEFVEWLKDRFDKRIDEQTAKCERIECEGDDGTYLTSYLEYVANNEGILTGFVNAKWWLEELDTIEKFMEEHNGKQD